MICTRFRQVFSESLKSGADYQKARLKTKLDRPRRMGAFESYATSIVPQPRGFMTKLWAFGSILPLGACRIAEQTSVDISAFEKSNYG